MPMEKAEIIIYKEEIDQTDFQIEVRVDENTVWLTQMQMAELFQTSRNNNTLHIGNVFKEGELEQVAVCKDSLLTASDGKKYNTKFYNLDVIISLGYRVKSLRGTQFRIWANKVLKEYLLKGHAISHRFAHGRQAFRRTTRNPSNLQIPKGGTMIRGSNHQIFQIIKSPNYSKHCFKH